MDELKTPYYIFDVNKIENNYLKMKKQMEPCHIFYSMKANPEIEIAEVLNKIGCCFEISSIAEAQNLQKIGVKREKIYCGLPVMTVKQLQAIEQAGSGYYVFDTKREWNLLNIYTNNAKKILRINIADIVPGSIDYGMSVQFIEEFLKKQEIFPNGLSFHISDHNNMELTISALERAESFLKRYYNIKLINIGGSYDLLGDERAYRDLRYKILDMVNLYGVTFLCEPGSAIINSAVSVISQCVYIECREGFYDVFVDAGIPTGVMRKPGEVHNLSRQTCGNRTIYRFFDTTSMKKLLFQTFLKFDIQEGDFLEFTEYGAYSICYSNRFHSQPKPPIIMKKGEKIGKELVSDVFR